MHHQYDKSSKWLIQHYGDSILRLAGVRDFVAWRPLAAELVQSRRLPDGLIEVRRQGQTEQDLYILEIATYPEARVAAQVACDAALVYLDRGVLPEVVVLFLHPRGNIKAASTVNLRSRQGLTHWRLSWKIAKLWEVPAFELLGAGDVGLIPWVPLTQFDGPPEPIMRLCRDRIDQDEPPDEHENLLAVTQFLARLRYDDPRLFQILGGGRAMIESPLLDELKAEWTRARREHTQVPRCSFRARCRGVEDELKAIDERRLEDVLSLAATCRSLASFRKKLSG